MGLWGTELTLTTCGQERILGSDIFWLGVDALSIWCGQSLFSMACSLAGSESRSVPVSQ